MKQKMMRVLAVVLAFTLTVSNVRISIWAETADQKKDSVSGEMDDMEILGTDSVGGMVAAALTEEQRRTDGANAVLGLDVSGDAASVTYRTEADCDIVVAVYEEDTNRMISSGAVSVPAGEDAVSVGLGGGQKHPGILLRRRIY